MRAHRARENSTRLGQTQIYFLENNLLIVLPRSRMSYLSFPTGPKVNLQGHVRHRRHVIFGQLLIVFWELRLPKVNLSGSHGGELVHQVSPLLALRTDVSYYAYSRVNSRLCVTVLGAAERCALVTLQRCCLHFQGHSNASHLSEK